MSTRLELGLRSRLNPGLHQAPAIDYLIPIIINYTSLFANLSQPFSFSYISLNGSWSSPCTCSKMPPRDAKRRRLVFDDFDSREMRYRHSNNLTPSSPSSSSYAILNLPPPSPLPLPLPLPQTQFNLEIERQKASGRLKAAWDDICRRYGRDFGNETDVVDIMTGEIIEDHGHLSKMGGAGPTDVWRPKRRYRKRNKDGILQDGYDDADTSDEDEDEDEDEQQVLSDDEDDNGDREYGTDQSDELLSAPATSSVYSSSPLKRGPVATRSSRRSYALVSSPPPPGGASAPPSPPQSSSSSSDYDDSENVRSKKVHDLDVLIQSWSNEARVKDDAVLSRLHAGQAEKRNEPVVGRQSADISTPNHKPSTKPPDPSPSLGTTKQQEYGVVLAPPSSPVLECGVPGYHCGRNFCFSCI
ncbi:hypothetical protein V1509DRAFT_634157 [Lipomyces kononenkoae]